MFLVINIWHYYFVNLYFHKSILFLPLCIYDIVTQATSTDDVMKLDQ